MRHVRTDGKRVAIVQSNYIPWKGYFDLIASVDEFIVYDEVQYTRRDWRNRNRIKTPQGLQWLTVPVKVRGRYIQTIAETELADDDWGTAHWRVLEHNYRRAACFDEVASIVEPCYRMRFSGLSDLNGHLTRVICGYLGIATRISDSRSFPGQGDRVERLVQLCAHAGAHTYVSGPSARSYLDERAFAERGMRVEWHDYGGYPAHPQLWGGFVHEVTILDLLFNCGREAPRYMKFRADGAPDPAESR